MALHDWSMNMLGYPAHQRNALRVVGTTHMSAHVAFRVAQQLGFDQGWLLADGEQPHIEGFEPGQVVAATLDDLFIEQRVAYTEGIVSGSVLFVEVGAQHGNPPADRDLLTWTEACDGSWMQVVDNETVFFGGLSDQQIRQLLCWFLVQRPLEAEWSDFDLDAACAQYLMTGLFTHGWTRNYSLVLTGWRPTVDLWGGIHTVSMLAADELKRLGSVQHGVRCVSKGGVWSHKRLHDEDCPLDDETGRATPRLED